jgi:hypothetical protein
MNEEWTLATLKHHFDSLRAADQRALEIKETGDAKALELAREIQTYKDEKANELREQINNERGLYATKAEIAPLTAFVLSEQGRNRGMGAMWAVLAAVVALVISLSGILIPLIFR